MKVKNCTVFTLQLKETRLAKRAWFILPPHAFL